MKLVKTLFTSLAVVGLDSAMAPLGSARIVLDGLAYALIALAIGVFRLEEILAFVRLVRERRENRA